MIGSRSERQRKKQKQESEEQARAVLHLVRHPLDVAGSDLASNVPVRERSFSSKKPLVNAASADTAVVVLAISLGRRLATVPSLLVKRGNLC